MTDFLAVQDRALLERHGLGNFDALWANQLEAVDEPNTAGGGWSSVFVISAVMNIVAAGLALFVLKPMRGRLHTATR